MGSRCVRRWVKHFKDGNTDSADQLQCGRLGTAATERNKQNVDEFIGQDKRVTVRETAVKPGVGHHEAQEMMEFCSHWVPCLLTGTKKHKMAWDCSPIHPTVQTWPPQTTTCSGP